MSNHAEQAMMVRVRFQRHAIGVTLALCALSGCRQSELTSAPAFSVDQTREANGNSIRHLPQRYIVTLRTPIAELGAKASQLANVAVATRGRVWKIINGFEVGGLSEEGVQRLQAHPDVRSVRPDRDDVLTMAQPVSGEAGLWGLDRIDQRTGPAYDGMFDYFFSGAGVKIYIVDSGIYPHADFGSRLGTGFSAISDPNPYVDPWGHGTVVASVAGGAVTGVAKSATLSSVRVVRLELDNGVWKGLASTGDQVDGLDWIRSRGSQGGAVVNYSISPTPSNSFHSDVVAALNQLSTNGFVVVVAAGNWNHDACIQGRDAFTPYIIVVSAVDINNQRAVFGNGAANYGPCVDIFAPGAAVATRVSPGAIQQFNPAWGTSMAAPFVSGVAATIRQQRPTELFYGEAGYIISNTTTNDVLDQQTLGAGSPNKLLNSLHRWVWITGPTVIPSIPATTATWTAQPVGGNGTWTYQWYASIDGGAWTLVGSSSSYTRTIAKFSDYQLQLKIVGTSYGETAPILPPATITVTCGGC